MRNTKLKLLARAFLTVTSALLISASGGRAYETYGQEDLPSETIGQIIEDREKTRGYVEFVHSKFDPLTAEYARAMLLYNNVMATYSGWVESVATAIERDAVKKLTKNKDFQQRSRKAAESAKQFVSYVESLPIKPQGKGGLAILGSLFDIGGKIADKIVDIRKKFYEGNKVKAEAEKLWMENRAKLAESFRSKAKWQTWGEIVTPKKPEAKSD